MRTRPDHSESLDASNTASFLLQRRDDIVASWFARRERPSCTAPGEDTAERAGELVTAIVRAATTDPACPAAADERRALARAAASHGARWRAVGGSVTCVPYENSVMFEAFWSAIVDAPIDEEVRRAVVQRVQQALGICLMAALLGYELGGDPARRAALDAALEQCCVGAVG